MSKTFPHTVEVTIPHAEAKAFVIHCIRTRETIFGLVKDEADWCTTNATEGWRMETGLCPAVSRMWGLFDSEGNPLRRDYSTWIFSFENERDAALFKLFHGGAR